jgi:hypothetical protein
VAHQRSQQHRIGAGQRRAEDCSRGSREGEKPPGGQRDERRRKQRARAEDEYREPPLQLHLTHVQTDRVAEQHQHQTEGGDHLQGRRVERQLHQLEPRRAEHGAEEQEDGDLGDAGPLHHAREERRDQDHEPDQGERRGEAFVGHGHKYGHGLACAASRMVT